MEMSNGNKRHSHELGFRVHQLANLGGLIAIAGLDLEPPDFLLGALLSLAQEAAKLSQEQREQVCHDGPEQTQRPATGARVDVVEPRSSTAGDHAEQLPTQGHHRSVGRGSARGPDATAAGSQPDTHGGK